MSAALLTPDEVAERLRVNVRTVRRLVAAGRLPCVRIGRCLRFEEVALEQLVAASRERSAPTPRPAPQLVADHLDALVAKHRLR